MKDIETRDDLYYLVNAFSERLKTDSDLAPFFEQTTGIKWETHKIKMAEFWEFILFSGTEFKGDVFGTHTQVFARLPYMLPHFERWLDLFSETLDTFYQGKKATELKLYAAHIAKVIKVRSTGSTANASSKLAYE